MVAFPRNILAWVLAVARGTTRHWRALMVISAVAAFGSSRCGTVRAADLATRCARMAPIEAYLMDRTQETALAKSAAPTAERRLYYVAE